MRAWPGSVGEFAGQLDPLALRGEALVGLPVRAGIDRSAHLLEGDGEIEVRVGVAVVERERNAIRRFRIGVTAVVVMDIPEIEMRLEYESSREIALS